MKLLISIADLWPNCWILRISICNVSVVKANTETTNEQMYKCTNYAPRSRWMCQLKRNKNYCNLYEWCWRIMSNSNCTTIRTKKTYTRTIPTITTIHKSNWYLRQSEVDWLPVLHLLLHRLRIVRFACANFRLRNFMMAIIYFALIRRWVQMWMCVWLWLTWHCEWKSFTVFSRVQTWVMKMFICLARKVMDSQR